MDNKLDRALFAMAMSCANASMILVVLMLLSWYAYDLRRRARPVAAPPVPFSSNQQLADYVQAKTADAIRGAVLTDSIEQELSKYQIGRGGGGSLPEGEK